MNAEPLELAGILICCAAAAYALVAADPRHRLAAIAVALLAAPLLVLGNVWDEPRIVDLRESPLTVAAGLAAGAATLAACVVAFRRWPEAFPVAAIALLPLRVPLEIGGETANLLVPLYVVIAAAAISSALARGVDDGWPGPPPQGRDWPRAVRLLLALMLVFYAAQATYSEDVSNAIENIGFFLVPFAVLFALLVRVEWTARLLRLALGAAGAVAVLVALVALGQYALRDLFLNPELFDANQLHQYFRVNSVFFDPNILGRYLALAITALATCLAWNAERRLLAAAALACGLCLAALGLSYSITSLAALLGGLGVLALLRWGWRGAVAAGGLGVVGLATLAIAGGTPSSDIQSDRYFDSGRESLLEGGIELFEDRPAAGFGAGGFGQAFFDRIERARTTVSHSEPVTVAAEQGVIGLVPYLALLIAALFALLGGDAARSTARSAVAACFAAMLVHSFGYAGFLTDPASWALLALGVSLRR